MRGDRLLFAELSLRLASGELLQVHGPNGSGKTTLLRVLCGLTEPLTGTIRWEGSAYEAQSSDYRDHLAYVGHANGVKLELTALENLQVAQTLTRSPPPVDPATALERFELSPVWDIPASYLSAGQRRRIALARLLITGAHCWLLDEPFSALDKHGVELMESLLQDHLRAGGLVALTSHQPLRLSHDAVLDLHLPQ